MSNCPFCESSASTLYAATDENRKISKDIFHYAQCSSCESIYLLNAPSDLGRYYGDSYYAIPNLSDLQKLANKDRNKILTVQKFARSGRLLEVGPAFGVFALQAKQAGFTVDVIEMDARCCSHLRDSVQVNVTQSNDPTTALVNMPIHDVIALWHVFEHLPNPLQFLRAAAANLKPGGHLVIAMPNLLAWQFARMGRHWPHLDAPRHLNFIKEAALSRHAKALGLENVYFTTTDSDARSWNRFGWQRLLMNRMPGKWLGRVGFVLGYLWSLAMVPFETKDPLGSSYTVIYRKI
jgi:2-polyprenyl-3-methyl-5-hydroxy-6-metoxy-1,4-benzoquinol methylase